MKTYKLKTGKIGDKVSDAYKTVENTAVNTYKKIEDTAVGAYKKIETAFVNTFLEEVQEKDQEESTK